MRAMPDPDALRPDRFYVIGDAGSFYEDETCPDGFETPVAAADWARTQTHWGYGAELDFSDGVTSAIVLGRDVNAANEAWEQWAEDTSQPYLEVRVHNHAIELGLVTEAEGRQA